MRPGLLVTAALSWAPSASASPCDADPELATAVASKLTFETGHARLSEAAKIAIEPVVRVMHARTDLQIVVTGHATDPHGGDTAKRRAEVVKWYLVDAGIMPDRIDTRVNEQVAASVIELSLSCAPADPKTARRVDPKPAPPPDRKLDADLGAALTTKLTFELGHARLTNAAKAALRPIVAAMHARPEMHLVIVAHHTGEHDPRIDETAKRRADVIKWYLVDGSIMPDRIETRVSTLVTPGSAIELQVTGDTAPTMIVARPAVSGDAKDLANVLFGEGSGRGRRLGANLEQQIAEARRQQQLAVGSSSAPRTQATAPAAATVHPLEITTPVARTGGETTTRARYGVPVTSVLPAPDVFTRKITTVYMAGLAHCYRKSLAMEPGMSGRIQVSFAIDATGATVEPDANGVDSDLDACVRKQMARWRFAPTDDPTARFSVSLVLQAN